MATFTVEVSGSEKYILDVNTSTADNFNSTSSQDKFFLEIQQGTSGTAEANKNIIEITTSADSDSDASSLTIEKVNDINLVVTTDFVVSHPTISAASSVNNDGSLFIQDVLLDQYGHVTGLAAAYATGTGIGGGSSTFLNLTDTPSSFVGQGSKFVAVNSAASALEFVSGVSSSSTDAFVTGISYNSTNHNLVLSTHSGTVTGVLSNIIHSGDNISQLVNDSGYITGLIEDTNPTLSANLQLNNNNIVGTGNISISGNVTANTGIYNILDMTPLANGSAPTHSEGLVWYDVESHALVVYNDEAEITQQLGQEEYLRVRNNTTGTISNGSAVRINGAHGNAAPTIELASATTEDKSNVVGIVTHDIETNSFGYVTTFGIVRDVDTSDYSAGDELYLSITSGALTGVVPTIPNYSAPIGYVIRSHSNGSLLVELGKHKLGGGDLKSEAAVVLSGVPFVTTVADTNAGGLTTSSDFVYDSGNQNLFIGGNEVVVSGDNISLLTNDSGYATTGQLASTSGHLQNQIDAIPADTNTFVTGLTFDSGTNNLVLQRNDSASITGQLDGVLVSGTSYHISVNGTGVDGSGRTYVQDILVDSYGHITGVATSTETVVDTNDNVFVTGILYNSSTHALVLSRNSGTVTGILNNVVHTGDNVSVLTNDAGYLVSGDNISVLNNNVPYAISGSHIAISNATGVDSSGRTYVQDIRVDEFGHITGVTTAAETGVDTNTEYTDGTGLVLVGTEFNISGVPVSLLNGIIDSSNLPSYVDDVLEYNGTGNFPASGTTSIIYLDTSGNDTYRWGGSSYIELTDDTAVWGQIGGTLSNQTDVYNAINAKAASGDNVSIFVNDVPYAISGTHITITNAASNVNNSGNDFVQDLLFDQFGHVTGVVSQTVTDNDVNTFVTGITYNSATHSLVLDRNSGSVTGVLNNVIHSGDNISLLTNDANYIDGSGYIQGSGTNNFIPVFSGVDTITNSIIHQSGDRIGIGTTNPATAVHIVAPVGNEGTVLSRTLDDTSFAGHLIRDIDDRNVASFQYCNSGVSQTGLRNHLLIGSRESGIPVKFYQGRNTGQTAFKENNERIIFDTSGNTTLTAASGQFVNVSGNIVRLIDGYSKLEQRSTDPTTGAYHYFYSNDLLQGGLLAYGSGYSAGSIMNMPSGSLHLFSNYEALAISTFGVDKPIVFGTYASSSTGERMRIAGDGKVGIGTNAPVTKLDVSGTITASGGNSTQWNTAYGWGDHSTSGYLTAHPNISGASSSNNSGQVFIQDVLLDTNGHVTGLATATASGGGGLSNIVEDTSPQLGGNLDLNSKAVTGVGGINIAGAITGTHSVTVPLVVAEHTYSPTLDFNATAFSREAKIRLLSHPLDAYSRFQIMGVDSATELLFYTNNTERMRVNINGNVGIGATVPNYKLDVAGSGSFDALNINDAYTFPTGDGTAGHSLVTDGAGNIIFSGVTGGGTDTFTTGIVFNTGDKSLVLNRSGGSVTGTLTNVLVSGNNVSLLTNDAGYLTSHPSISSASSSDNSGRTYIQDILLDSNGHVTGIATATETVTDTNTEYTAGTGLDLSGTEFNIDSTVLTTGSSISSLSNVNVSAPINNDQVLSYSSGFGFTNTDLGLNLMKRGSIPFGGYSDAQMGHYFFFDGSSEAVINTDGDDINFRVEGSGGTNLLFADAGTDRVGIGTDSPTEKLDIRDGDILVGTKLLVGSGVYSQTSPGAYFGLKHTSLTGLSEYMIMSAGTHTYLSAKEDSNVYIRGGGNKTDHQIMVSESGITIGKYRPAASSVVAEHDVELVYDDGGCVRIADRGGSGVMIGDCAYSDSDTYAGMKHSNHTGGQEYMIISAGHSTVVSSKTGNSTYIRAGGNTTTYQGVFGTSAFGIGPNANRLRVDSQSVIVNNGTGDYDFKVYGYNNATQLIHADAALHRVGIGTATPAYKLDVVYPDSGCVRFADPAGSGIMIGDCALSSNATYAGMQHTKMVGTYMMVSDGDDTYISARDTQSVFIRGGGNAAEAEISIHDVGVGGVGIVFNEQGADRDIRMEGASDANLFRLDASTDRIGIGTATPAYTLDVAGSGSFNALNINDAYTFPTGDGTAGHSLVTDGAGNIVFSGIAGGVGGSGNLVRGSEVVTATTGLFDVSGGYSVGTLDVYQNGIKLFEGASYDYTATNGSSFSLINPATSGDLIEYIGLNTSTNAVGNTSLGTVTVTSNQDVFNTVDTFTSSNLAVFLNGVKLVDGEDYNVTSTSQFTLDSVATSGDIVEYIAYGATVASSNLQKTGDTMTGNLTVNADLIVKGYKETHTDNGNTGTAQTIDISSSTLQTYTLTGNCTFTMPTAEAGRSFTMFLKTGAGSFSATFTGVKFPLNAAPTITTDANRMDLITFYSDGTNWYGNIQQEYHI